MIQSDAIYWNSQLETMPENGLKQLQLNRLKKIVSFAYDNSIAYKKLYDSNGFNPNDIQSLEDIEAIPLIDKSFFYDSKVPLSYDKGLCVDNKDVIYFHQTSGSTSAPLAQPDTDLDWQFHAECWAEALWAQGVRRTDKVMIAFNYNLFIGFWQAHYGCEKIGVELITTGGLSTEIRLHKIMELGVTVLITTPTYAFRLAESAEKLGIDIRESPIKKIILSGEPGALIGGVKEKLERQWNAEVFDVIGATEVGTWGFECLEHPGGIHLLETMFYTELVDIETEELITEPGKYGKLIITNLFRKGRPCIRFDTKDIACWSEITCNCGRSFRLLSGGVQGRTDHLMKVRGTFFNPSTIEDIISREDECSHEYRIIIQKDCYTIDLLVEAAEGVDKDKFVELAESLKKKISTAIFLRLDVNVVPFGTLERFEAKTNKIIDLREREINGRKRNNN